MARVAINKTSLKQQRERLRLYQRFLPSLELKKQQLLTEHKRARRELEEAERELRQLDGSVRELLQPLGASRINLSGLVRVESVELEEENVVGARLPILRAVHFTVMEYSTLAKPFWVDFLVDFLRRACTLRIRLQVQRERFERLRVQVRRITQRVNLFEKVLIPTARENIKRIQVGLSERERTAVVRSKIAKAKHSQ